jgi:hypothetical protein
MKALLIVVDTLPECCYDCMFFDEENWRCVPQKKHLKPYIDVTECVADWCPLQLKYKMGKPQPAQIDCRMEKCIHHGYGGACNTEPAITLNQIRKFICWTLEESEE